MPVTWPFKQLRAAPFPEILIIHVREYALQLSWLVTASLVDANKTEEAAVQTHAPHERDGSPDPHQRARPIVAT
ncbi:hypothetical protein [Streptomyces griseocarneus]|uniref:hypothetical protein n=1 Tax=Streptomyces griseocarneus TaxID=51201 RepID=UPI00167C5875|nr:hypothetical protein [Streptomyces griseocarneus]MBZ6476143.1 hypothetical protein [Streptomyces griseocarneus]GHG63757.1 hypothetical protein GCM10018779_33660 [Streptomyces griseocarneus]